MRCQDYRHIRFCTAPFVCAKCAGSHETHDCTVEKPNKCVNCNGHHWASSWNCPRYKQEQDVEAVRERERTTYNQAEAKIKSNEKNKSPKTH